MSNSRHITICHYCEGPFPPARSDAKTCSGACKMATHRAVKAEFVTPAIFRRDANSDERKAATGWGIMTPMESEFADYRVRAAAGIDDGVELAPDPLRFDKLAYWKDVHGEAA